MRFKKIKRKDIRNEKSAVPKFFGEVYTGKIENERGRNMLNLEIGIPERSYVLRRVPTGGVNVEKKPGVDDRVSIKSGKRDGRGETQKQKVRRKQKGPYSRERLRGKRLQNQDRGENFF